MTPETTQRSVWPLVRRQHGVIRRQQLHELGFTDEAIRHRLAKGRLHRVWPDVYAVGRPQLEQEGLWMAAVLTCGTRAVLSHDSAAQLWGVRKPRGGAIHVSVPSPRDPRRRGIRVHRRGEVERTRHQRIPVTTPAQTIVDLAPRLTQRQLERVIDEADKLDLAHPDELHRMAQAQCGRGPSIVCALLSMRMFLLTDSDLERLLIPLAERAGLPTPETQVVVNGHRVDFYFRERGLVVEADGGRYHRTPSEQRRDRIRDHAHAVAGLTSVRFTHDQIAHEPRYVARILRRL
jgi:very-short-patch-repair endonuclease/predicted transcriptional regulator of viral defense system